MASVPPARIDNERPDIRDRRWQNACDDREHGESYRQSAVRAPNQLDGAPAVAEHAEETAHRDAFGVAGSRGRAPRNWVRSVGHQCCCCEAEVAGAIGCLTFAGASPVINREPRRKNT